MRKLLLSLMMLALAGCGGADGDDVVPAGDPDDNVRPLASVGVVEGALYADLAVNGDLVYGCTASHGMRIASLGADGALTTTVEQATFDQAAGCRTVSAAPDGVVFVGGEATGGGSWIAQVDADGTATNAVTTSAGLVETVTATETHVFAAVGSAGLVIFGRNDGALAQVGALTEGFDRALGVAVWGDRLLVADGLSGVALVDISDPTAPAIESHFDTKGTARRVLVRDDLAYVGDVGGGVTVYDPEAGKKIGTWKPHGSAVDLAFGEGDRLLVANLEDLCILDASDPAELHLVATEVLPGEGGRAGRVIAVRATAGLALAAEWSGLWTFDYSTVASPDIHLSRTALDLGVVSLKSAEALIIENLGMSVLDIIEVTVDHPDFEVTLDDDRLGPGKKTLLTVEFEPSDDKPITGTVTLTTNDPDERTVHIPLSANAEGGLQVGAPFDPTDSRIFSQYETAANVTVGGEYPGKVVILAWFGTS